MLLAFKIIEIQHCVREKETVRDVEQVKAILYFDNKKALNWSIKATKSTQYVLQFNFSIKFHPTSHISHWRIILKKKGSR